MRGDILAQAIAEVGGVGKVAELFGLTPSAISQWKRVPADRAVQLARATGGKFTPEMLRPDVFKTEAA